MIIKSTTKCLTLSSIETCFVLTQTCYLISVERREIAVATFYQTDFNTYVKGKCDCRNNFMNFFYLFVSQQLA